MKFEEILERTRFRELSQGEAASVPGVSERTFLRWRVRFEAEGAEGLYDRRLGRASARRVCGGDKLDHGSGGICPAAGGVKLCHL